MSENEELNTLCANCGIAEIDDIKLKNCDGCDLVRYCSDECREGNKSQHEEECKKRAAELRDELLFKQPVGSHLGDCPICLIPLPPGRKKSAVHNCCSKIICHGCRYANQKREEEMKVQITCPFCREPVPGTDEEAHRQRMKRVEANDPVAMCQEGNNEQNKGNYGRAFEYFTKAAELGNARGHYGLSFLYDSGQGVEMDKGKVIHHLEEAAIAGHPHARYALGCEELKNENYDRALKHWFVAATQGDDESIKRLMHAFREGVDIKDVLDIALRAHKAAADATMSPQREAAQKYYQQTGVI